MHTVVGCAVDVSGYFAGGGYWQRVWQSICKLHTFWRNATWVFENGYGSEYGR